MSAISSGYTGRKAKRACRALISGEYVRRVAKSRKGQYGASSRRQAGMERRQVAQTADVPSAQAGDESGPVGRVLPSGKLAHG